MKFFTKTTAVILVMNALCLAITAQQTAYLVATQEMFAAAYPSIVSHSWILFTLMLGLTVLSVGQLTLARKRGDHPGAPGLCCSISVLMIVLEIFALRASATQHYNMGLILSDYSLDAPFMGGWLLLILGVALIAATIVQLMNVFLTALSDMIDSRSMA